MPGAAGLGGFWSPVIERLPPTWRTRAVDLPGLGTVPPHPAVTGYDSLVDHVARAVSAPTVLVGQSMGGFVALQLALRYPQLVTHLVLVVTTGGVDMAACGASDWRAEYCAAYPGTALGTRVPDLTDQLRTLTIPVLLLWATHDILSPLSVARTTATRIAPARLVTFETDDHRVARRYPDETARAYPRAPRWTR